ncbi:hypothetical protein [Clostridium drakei]|uniref:Uncharacterized protein n=1 Tax=Clostridium drakei TaxID=332101 RepID=A0A2U8DMW3_9CLOT|nr:hypothetical protein [Clostridium drakei]AWI04079.1 hypothetical protein B9W14_06085 [Clostridium drakei]
MLKLKNAEKEYEVSNCFESITWTENRKEKLLTVMLQDSAKSDFTNLVGQEIKAAITNNDIEIINLNDYRIKEITKNYNFDIGINVRFEKVAQ